MNTGNDGTGRLKIRVADENELKDITGKIRELGMDAQPHTEKHELKQYFFYSNFRLNGKATMLVSQNWIGQTRI